jgi:hypothetical protein
MATSSLVPTSLNAPLTSRNGGRPPVADNRESTDLVAKLLAREDITIVHRKGAVTASFDGVSRTLTLPIWQDMSADLVDMLVAHETGHALHTPAGEKPIIDAIASIDSNESQWSIVKTYLNVIEDIRIEREIKEEFPGVKRSFARGYRELLEKNFFDIDAIPMESRTLADRINLHAKIGHMVQIPFTDYERGILSMCETARTWEDVVEAAREAYIYDGTKSSKRKENMMSVPSLPQENDEEGEDSSDGMDVETDAEGNSSSDSPNDGKSSGKSSDTNEKTDEETEVPSSSSDPSSKNDGESDSDERQSAANMSRRSSEEFSPPTVPASAESLERNLGNLSSAGNSRVLDRAYGSLPTLVDAGCITIDYPMILDAYRMMEGNIYEPQIDIPVLDHAMNAMTANTNRQINTMAREFERRRAAIASRKVSRSNSGSVIDVNRLHAYRFSDEIFRVSTTKRDGKSHGLMMFVDWSGSMSSVIGNTVNQAILLAAFCRKVRIPFEMYGFSSVCPGEIREHIRKALNPGHVIDTTAVSGESINPWSNRAGEFSPHRFTLLNILSSRMTRKDFSEACRGLMMHTARMGGNEYISRANEVLTGRKVRYNSFCPKSSDVQRMMNSMGLSGTPLNSCAIAAFTLIPKFRKENRLQIVSSIFLTDGGASDSIFNGNISEKRDLHDQSPAVTNFSSEFNWRNYETWMRTPKNRRGLQLSKDSSNGSSLTGGILRALGEHTNTRVIGFDIHHMSSWKRLGKNYRFTDYFPALPGEHPTNHQERGESILKKAEKENFLCVSGEQAKKNGYDELYVFITGQLSSEATNALDKVSANASITKIRNAFINQESGNCSNRTFVNRFVELISTEL